MVHRLVGLEWERKREKLEAWKLRIKSSEHELMLWKRRKEHKRGQVSPFQKKGTRKKYGETVSEVEDDAECRRKLDEQRKKMQRELREVEKLSLASKGNAGEPQGVTATSAARGGEKEERSHA